jgi:hypothetical protein
MNQNGNEFFINHEIHEPHEKLELNKENRKVGIDLFATFALSEGKTAFILILYHVRAIFNRRFR